MSFEVLLQAVRYWAENCLGSVLIYNQILVKYLNFDENILSCKCVAERVLIHKMLKYKSTKCLLLQILQVKEEGRLPQSEILTETHNSTALL